jgi:hypothetical protein
MYHGLFQEIGFGLWSMNVARIFNPYDLTRKAESVLLYCEKTHIAHSVGEHQTLWIRDEAFEALLFVSVPNKPVEPGYTNGMN